MRSFAPRSFIWATSSLAGGLKGGASRTVCGFQVPRTTLPPLSRWLSFSVLFPFCLESPDCGVAGSPGSQVARRGRSPARPRPVYPQRPLPARPAACQPARAGSSAVLSAASLGGGGARLSGARRRWEAHSSARPPPTAEPLQPWGNSSKGKCVAAPSNRRSPCTCGTSWGQAQAVKTWIGTAAGPRAWGSGRRGTSPAIPCRRRCRCAPGASPGAGFAGSPLSLALGWPQREKIDFSPYPEGTGAVPTLGLGPLELFAPFWAVCVDMSQTGCSQIVARPRRRKGCAQLYLPLHCKCQKVNFLPDFFRGFQLTFP